MEERKARIAVVMVLVGLLLAASAAWGQGSSSGWAGQPEQTPRRVVRPPADVEIEVRLAPPERIDELNRRRDELTERAHQRQMELQELQEAQAARERELRGELSDIYAELASVEANLTRLQQRQAEARRRALARMEEASARMSERLRDLSATADGMRQGLAELRETDTAQSQTLRDALTQTREQLRRLEMAPPVPPEEPPVVRRRRQIELEVEPAPEAPRVREELRAAIRDLREARQRLDEEQAQRQQSADADLSAKVDQLSLEVGQLNEQLSAKQTVVTVPPCAVRRAGTIGSAGYGYSWQPNYGLYYLY